MSSETSLWEYLDSIEYLSKKQERLLLEHVEETPNSYKIRLENKVFDILCIEKNDSLELQWRRWIDLYTEENTHLKNSAYFLTYDIEPILCSKVTLHTIPSIHTIRKVESFLKEYLSLYPDQIYQLLNWFFLFHTWEYWTWSSIDAYHAWTYKITQKNWLSISEKPHTRNDLLFRAKGKIPSLP